ncbi:MAG TPA: hypothetical protein VJU80_17145, partial [Solirubrobacteraceae bacterium]|nr:hypothetical protein [Solirubrobacteraceae bacterium]
CLFGIAGFAVARAINVFRLLRIWLAGFALTALALVLDGVGLHAAGWAALVLIVALFVLGASFIFGAGEAADTMLRLRRVDREPARLTAGR